jgi:hypothetical protein
MWFMPSACTLTMFNASVANVVQNQRFSRHRLPPSNAISQKVKGASPLIRILRVDSAIDAAQ